MTIIVTDNTDKQAALPIHVAMDKNTAVNIEKGLDKLLKQDLHQIVSSNEEYNDLSVFLHHLAKCIK